MTWSSLYQLGIFCMSYLSGWMRFLFEPATGVWAQIVNSFNLLFGLEIDTGFPLIGILLMMVFSAAFINRIILAFLRTVVPGLVGSLTGGLLG